MDLVLLLAGLRHITTLHPWIIIAVRPPGMISGEAHLHLGILIDEEEDMIEGMMIEIEGTMIDGTVFETGDAADHPP